jgi:hypothetical protein
VTSVLPFVFLAGRPAVNADMGPAEERRRASGARQLACRGARRGAALAEEAIATTLHTKLDLRSTGSGRGGRGGHMIQLRPEKAGQEEGARGEEVAHRDHSRGPEARRTGGGGRR